MDDRQQEHLQQQVDELRRQVEALRQELRGTTERAALTMRAQTRCPACGNRRILHADKVLDRDAGSLNELALIQTSVWSGKGAGRFEVFICTQCGLTEWYVKDLAELAQQEKHFAVIDATPKEESGPYR